MVKPGDPTLLSASDVAETHAEEYYCSACNQSYPSSETNTCPNDGARLIKLAAQRDLLIGKVLDERYEIRAPLGKGGMGTVYRGWQLSVDREVAIKVIHPKLADDRSAVKRFLREARLASRLSQPNIVNVYDFGQSDGVLFLVMELLRGHTLGSELGEGRRINAKRTVTMALQLCDALEAAHAQGIIHRDLKPSNIVILDDPPGRDLIKVLDFGLAKSLVQDSGSLVTNTDALLGTPLYMSPEQIEGKVSDQRADLYSLGCILYEMLSGEPPFVDTAVSAVLARHVSDTPVALPALVPKRLRTLIEGLLAKQPEDRIQTAGEVRRELEAIRDVPTRPTPPAVDELGATAPTNTIPDVSDGLAETHAATPVPTSVAITAPPSPSRRYGVVAVFVLVPLAVTLVLLNKKGGGDDSPGSVNLADDPGRNRVLVDAEVTPVVAKPPEATPPPPPLPDAGVASAVTVDAGVKKRLHTPATTQAQTHTQTQTQTPRQVDAGIQMPDIDFVKPTK